jgi:hypothetical protein
MSDDRDREIVCLKEIIASQDEIIRRLEAERTQFRAQSGWRAFEIAQMRRKLCNAVHKVARRGTR